MSEDPRPRIQPHTIDGDLARPLGVRSIGVIGKRRINTAWERSLAAIACDACLIRSTTTDRSRTAGTVKSSVHNVVERIAVEL